MVLSQSLLRGIEFALAKSTRLEFASKSIQGIVDFQILLEDFAGVNAVNHSLIEIFRVQKTF